MKKKLLVLGIFNLLILNASATTWYTSTSSNSAATVKGATSTGWSSTQNNGGTVGTVTIATGDNLVVQSTNCTVTVSAAISIANLTFLSIGATITTNASLTITGILTSNGVSVNYYSGASGSTETIILLAGCTVNNFIQTDYLNPNNPSAITTATSSSSGQKVLSLPNTTNLIVGMNVSGAGIGTGTTISSISAGVSVTLSSNISTTISSGTSINFQYRNIFQGKTGNVTLSGTNVFTGIASIYLNNINAILAANSNNTFKGQVITSSSPGAFSSGGANVSLTVAGPNGIYFDQTISGTTNSINTFTLNSNISSVTASSAIQLTAGSILNVTNLNLASGTLTNSGGIVITNGGAVTVTNGTISSTPTFTGGNVNITYNGAVTTGNELPSNIGTGTLTINSNVVLSANVTVNNLNLSTNASLNTSTDTVVVNGTAILNSNSTLTSSNGQITFNGLLTLNSGANLSIGKNNVVINGGVVGTGLVSTLGAIFTIGGGDGVLNFASSPNNSLASLNINLNSSTNTLNLGSSLVLTNGINIQNGIFNISGQKLNITGSIQTVQNTGTLTSSNTSDLALTSASGILNLTPNSKVFNNLYINSGTSAMLNDSLKIYGWLAINTYAALTTQGYLTLISNSVGTAAIDSLAGSLSGNVTVQRYISAKAARRYSFVGSPIVTTIRNSWQQQIYITGSGSGGVPCGSTTGDGGTTDKYNNNGFDVTQNNTPSMFTYNAAKVKGSHYVSIVNTDQTSLTPGTGYCINARGNRNSSNVTCANQLETSTPTPPEAVTLSATGTVDTGTINVSLNDTTLSKFTLLANPYPSPFSFTAFQTNNSVNIYNKMWTYSPFGSGNYTTYLNGVIANGATGYDNTSGNYIASGQAFFVQATQSGSAGIVAFQEMHKTHGIIPNTQYFGAAANKLIRVGLKSANDSSLLDEIVVRFSNDGSLVYNPKIDAQSLSNASQALVAFKGIERLAIATKPANFINDTIKLGIKSTSADVFNLNFSGYENLTTQAILLTDKFLNKDYDVLKNPIYNFNITADSASYGDNRFEVVFTHSTQLPVNFINISAIKNYGGTLVKWKVANELNIASYEIERSTNGSDFITIGFINAKELREYSFHDNHLPADATTLFYKIKGLAKDGSFSYSSLAKLTTNYSPITTFIIFPSPVKNLLNITLGDGLCGNYYLDILSMQGIKVLSDEGLILGASTISLNTNKLPSGTFIAKLTDMNGKVMTGKFMKL